MDKALVTKLETYEQVEQFPQLNAQLVFKDPTDLYNTRLPPQLAYNIISSLLEQKKYFLWAAGDEFYAKFYGSEVDDLLRAKEVTPFSVISRAISLRSKKNAADYCKYVWDNYNRERHEDQKERLGRRSSEMRAYKIQREEDVVNLLNTVDCLSRYTGGVNSKHLVDDILEVLSDDEFDGFYLYATNDGNIYYDNIDRGDSFNVLSFRKHSTTSPMVCSFPELLEIVRNRLYEN